MSMFGYDGLVELGGMLLDELFSDHVPPVAAGASDGVLTYGSGDEGTQQRVFLRLGPPGCDCPPAAESDTSIGLFLPFQVAVFSKAAADAQWERTPISVPPLGDIRTLVVGISPLALTRSGTDAVAPDVGSLTVSAIKIYVPYPAKDHLVEVTDQLLSEIPAESRPDLIAAKSQILGRLQAGIGGWSFEALSTGNSSFVADGV